MLVLSFFLLQKYIYKFNLKFQNTIFTNFSLTLLIFFLLSFFSLLHGGNNYYGLQKFYLLTVQLLPLIFITRFSIITWNRERTLAFASAILLIGLTASLSAFVLQPFNPFAAYTFSFTRWSHVAFGRFIIIPLLLTLYLLYIAGGKKKILINYFLTLLFSAALLSSGFRAGIIALYALLITLIIYNFLTPNSKILNLKSLLLLSLVFLLPLFLFIARPENIVNRVSGMEQMVSGSSIEDGTLTSRITAYKIAWYGGWDKPLFGQGLGSFMYASGSFTRQMKYPHNIFLEFFYEMGLIGLILLILILLLIFISLKKYGFWFLSPYLIFLWLSLFSKDIPSNALLFTGLAFIGNNLLPAQRK